MTGDVTQASYDIEQRVRKFHTSFSIQRRAFLAQIQGDIPLARRESYGLFTLNRIMFLFFLQGAGFLAHDLDYLSQRLFQVQQKRGKQSFYRHFWLPLLFEGFSDTRHSPDLSDLCKTLLPWSERFFSPHSLEASCYNLHIPDEAFSEIFAFFSRYQWCLDEHAYKGAQVIDPALLGAIFELSINQRQVGAYYTQNDVTAYIARNSILPYLFEAVQRLQPDCVSMPWSFLQTAPERYLPAALQSRGPMPGENASEYAARRHACENLCGRMRSGEVTTVDDMITCNLDILRLLLDIISSLPQLAQVQIWYEQLCQITVLDPTCGSGAFLFAALDILFPLYKACFARRRILEGEVGSALEEEICIVNLIIGQNLYGVDIMEEAVEMCRMRLLLKLFSYIKSARIVDLNMLPSLKKHIRVGNALCDMTASERSIVSQGSSQEGSQAEGEEPFCWATAFPEVLACGGFAVIIGNPPYVEYHSTRFSYVLRDFETLPCGNLYPCVIERSRQVLAPIGRHGMVLPLAAFATRNMQPFMDSFRRWFPSSWVSFYHFRPAMLFSGGKIASIPTAIYLAKAHGPEQRFSTHLHKWTRAQRPFLFSRLSYCRLTTNDDPANRHYYPKFGHPIENTILEKILKQRLLRGYLSSTPNTNTMFYRSAGGLYWKVFVNFPWPYASTSNKQCAFQEEYQRDIFVAVLNSSLFWWYYTVTFDTFNLKNYMLFGFRFTYPTDPRMLTGLREQCQLLMDDFRRHARSLTRGETGSYTLYARKSKPIINTIDMFLAHHYGLTAEELDFILHYDLQYRLGRKDTFEKGL